jgi:PIN domain nuclease of toxin-antitoxin system
VASEAVLDASAILAVLRREAGHEKVRAVLGRATASAVNLAEAGSSLTNRGSSMAAVRTALADLHLDIVPFDEEQAIEVARLRPLTRLLGFSLSDRACLALARRLRLPAMTTDRAWGKLNIGVQVTVIR